MGPLAKPSGLIVNFRPGSSGNVSTFSNAKAAMSSGTRPRVLYIGDSKTMGNNINGNGFTGASALSITKKIADLTTAAGLRANKNNAFFHQGVLNAAGYNAYDPRISSMMWTLGSRTNLAGNPMISVNPNFDGLMFQPDGIVDTVTIYFVSTTSTGVFDVFDGIMLVGTHNTAATPSLVRSVTFSLANRGSGKTISINRTLANTNQIDIAGIIAYDSTLPALDIVNAGRSGTSSSTWTSTTSAWSSIYAIQAFNPHLSVINLGSNDLAASVTPATFSANIQTVMNACKAGGGSVVLVNPTKGNTSSYGTLSEQEAYSAAILQLALSNDCPLIDEGASFGPFTEANAKGYFSDSIHENVAGTDVRAALHAQLLLAA